MMKLRKPGPTDLTWEEKNSGKYIYPKNKQDKNQGVARRGLARVARG